jgi:hypothetical protein
MIDTLKLSKQLQEAEVPARQAEAIAAGLAEGAKERFVTNDRLTAELARIKTELIVWAIGIAAAQNCDDPGAVYFMLLHLKP